VNPNMPLAPYYFEATNREGVLEHPVLWAFLGANWILGLAWFIRRRKGLA